MHCFDAGDKSINCGLGKVKIH